jgi:hypothetical protein
MCVVRIVAAKSQAAQEDLKTAEGGFFFVFWKSRALLEYFEKVGRR